jgi:glycosyltransferase involved in cell wall biosynthesis
VREASLAAGLERGELRPVPLHRRHFPLLGVGVERDRRRFGAGRDDRLQCLLPRGVVALLGGALATLYPVDVEEAFGLVMAESMACGTPVLALRRGSVPEVVEHSRTGFVVDEPDELCAAVGDARRIGRHVCREVVEERFSAPRLVQSYESAFARAVF